MRHLFQAHANERNFTYSCGILSCCYTFKPGSTYSGFLTHCNRKHPGWRKYLAERTMCNDEASEGDGMYSGGGDGDTIFQMEMDNVFTEEGVTMEDEEDTIHNVDINVIGARFLLNLKERHKLTQVALDYISEAVSELNEIIANKIKHTVSRKIEELGYDITSTLLNDCFIPTDPFLHLRTEYEQTKFYKEHFGLIVSTLSMQFS